MGFPGAGKSTFASRLSKVMGATYIGADTVAHELFPFPRYNEQERRQVFQEMRYRVEDSLTTGIPAIYDSNANTWERRQQIYRLADKYRANCFGIWITTPTDVSRRRALMPRNVQNTNYMHRISNRQFDIVLKAFELPSPSEPIIQIRGDISFLEQLKLYKMLATFYGGSIPIKGL